VNSDRFLFHLQAVCILLSILGLPGCLSGRNPSAPVEPAPVESGYVSEITLPAAKSFFAYGQYRLLASEGRWDEALEALERAVALDGESRYLRMGLARVYLHTKQQQRSIQVLQELLRQAPDYAEGHELIGDLFLHQNLPRDAVEHYRQALALEDRPASLRLKLAMALARHGDLAGAIEETAALLQERPDFLSAKLTLARFYRENRQFAEAVELYRELLDEKPQQIPLLLELGRLLEERNQADEALDLYRFGIAQNPRAVAVHDRMARLLVAQQRYPEALQLLRQWDDLHPDRVEILGRIGLLQLQMEHWAEAELTFRKLLRLDPEHARSRYYLGMALSGGGDYQGALRELAAVPEGSEIYLEAVTQQAYLYQLSEQPRQAIALLRRHLDGGLDDPVLYYYLSVFLAGQDQLTAAEEVLRQGLARHPDSAGLRYQRGIVFEKMERRDEARREMERVLAIDPDHADALNYLAYLKAERGEDLEQALLEAKRALAAKKTGYILDTLGWIYFKLGRFEEGREPLEKASQLQPDDTVVLEHLGDLYRALGLWSQAAQRYRQILELDPLADEIREKLEALPEGNNQ
jgi:tetratricopeptide (TPR) repeat protein